MTASNEARDKLIEKLEFLYTNHGASLRNVLELTDQYAREQRIDELKLIDGKRNIQEDYYEDDYIWCVNCHMVLEDAGQACACIFVTRDRIAQLSAPGNSKQPKGDSNE